jgi:hypothetical protein
VSSPSLAWFAEHEARARLARSDLVAPGQARRLARATLALVIVAAILHGVAYLVVSPYAAWADRPDKLGFPDLIHHGVVVGLRRRMLSQALETGDPRLICARRHGPDLVVARPRRAGCSPCGSRRPRAPAR